MQPGPTVSGILYNGPVIPAVRTMNDFHYALTETTAPTIILLFGDINILPDLLTAAKQAGKRIALHIDLFEGIGKDKAGIIYLARAGVTAIITTKTQLAKFARDQGLIVIQRLFVMDSEAAKTGIHMLGTFRPDALEILPASIPASIITRLQERVGLPILAGGLVETEEDIIGALKKGICAVSTNKKDLWNYRLPN